MCATYLSTHAGARPGLRFPRPLPGDISSEWSGERSASRGSDLERPRSAVESKRGEMTQTQPHRPASVPSELAVPERWRLGDAFVPKGRYIDREFLELELEQLFPKVWLNACRLEEVERVGSYVEFVVGDQSILVVRADPETIKAYYNSCRHRGTRLVQGRGRTGSFRCPFHGWMWELSGAVRYVYRRDEFLPRADVDLCLPEVKVDTWGGWVFINMDPEAEPLLDYLDPLPTELDGYRLEDMRFAWYKTVILPANWKTAIDAFIEAYHVAATHPGYVRPDMRGGTPTSIAEMETWMDSPTVTFDRHAVLQGLGRRRSAGADASSRSGVRCSLRRLSTPQARGHGHRVGPTGRPATPVVLGGDGSHAHVRCL